MDGNSLFIGLLAANTQLASELDELSIIGINVIRG